MRPLSITKYYGGKAKLCKEIAQMLDYKSSDVYIESFGGGCRTLLNKPPHEIEYYFEYDRCLRNLVNVLADREKSLELIELLHTTTEYSEDCFNEQLVIKNQYYNDVEMLVNLAKEKLETLNDKDIVKVFENQIEMAITGQVEPVLMEVDSSLKDGKVKMPVYTFFNFEADYDDELYKLLEVLSSIINRYVVQNEDVDLTDFDKYIYEQEYQYYMDMFDKVEALPDYTGNKIDRMNFMQRLYSKKAWKDFYNFHETYDILDTYGLYELHHSEVELAKAAFVVFSQSRNGMGVSFSKVQDKKSLSKKREYEKNINNLYKVRERLDGVRVLEFEDSLNILEVIFSKYNNAMVYLDPPYLMDENVAREKKTYYNPGKFYAKGWDVEDHIRFLEMIVSDRVKCKLLISNYNDINRLYDKYLNEQTGWRKREIITSTSMDGKGGVRTECLWYNY